MKSIDVKLRRPLASKDGLRNVAISYADDHCNVAQLLVGVQAAVGVSSSLHVAVNGELRSGSAPVKEGDDVIVFLPIAGG